MSEPDSDDPLGGPGCTVEMLKRGNNGTYVHVSGKHLSKYLGELEYRWDMRHVPHLMLERLMHSFAR
jgi:hypothetical protein